MYEHGASRVSEGVTFEAVTVAGMSGWWARPTRAQKGATIIHVHGGWFNWGTAQGWGTSTQR
jgi:monoterpene epsilon-lactone hydrolase